MIGIGVIGTLMNTYGAKHLPVLEGIVLIVHIFGFFCIIIPLWVLAPKAPAREVFGTFDNFGGWSSIGAACFVGSITATGSFAGSDAAVHLSEETKDASKSVPRMIIFTIVLNGAMGLVFIITYVGYHLFCFVHSRRCQRRAAGTYTNPIFCSASASPISRPSSCQRARSHLWT
jgi:choline transport protein